MAAAIAGMTRKVSARRIGTHQIAEHQPAEAGEDAAEQPGEGLDAQNRHAEHRGEIAPVRERPHQKADRVHLRNTAMPKVAASVTKNASARVPVIRRPRREKPI